MNPRRDYVEVVCPEFKRPRPVAKVTAMARKFTGVCVECHNKSIREAAMARLEEIRRAKMVSSFVPKNKRRCLKCDQPFKSTGPENRLCSACARQNRQEGEDMYSIAYSGERG